MEKRVYTTPDIEVDLLLNEDIVLVSIVDGQYDADSNATPWDPSW